MIDADEIADRFGLGAAGSLEGPLAEGHQGEVWRLETDRGSWAVKRGFGAQAEDEVAEGVAFQEAALAAGVVTPRPVRTTAGAVLADIGFGQVRVDEWADLGDADPGIDPALVGAAFATLHQVPFTGATPLDEWFTEMIPADRWERVLAELEEVGAPFAPAVAVVCDDLVALAAKVEPPVGVRTCHRDLFADNVRRGADGRVWVFDWQECGFGDPSHELALGLFEFAAGDPARAAALHEAYRGAGGPGRIDGLTSFGTLVAQLGHILEIACRRWIDGRDSAEVRATNEAWVAEFTDKPLTVEVAEVLVDAIR
jgi:Ser/Thr protein kinase RdoA (MazF antagonist)